MFAMMFPHKSHVDVGVTTFSFCEQIKERREISHGFIDIKIVKANLLTLEGAIYTMKRGNVLKTRHNCSLTVSLFRAEYSPLSQSCVPTRFDRRQ